MLKSGSGSGIKAAFKSKKYLTLWQIISTSTILISPNCFILQVKKRKNSNVIIYNPRKILWRTKSARTSESIVCMGRIDQDKMLRKALIRFLPNFARMLTKYHQVKMIVVDERYPQESPPSPPPSDISHIFQSTISAVNCN